DITWCARIVTQLAAQGSDVHVDRTIEGTEFTPTHVLEQLLARAHAAAKTQQRDQQIEFNLGEREAAFAQMSRARVHVEGQITGRELVPITRRCGSDRTPEARGNTRDQLPRRYRLRNTILGALLESGVTILFATARGEHHNRN